MKNKKEYEACLQLVEEQLNTYFIKDEPQKELFEAMRYSLLAGGKRIRPIIVLKFAEAVGGNREAAMPFACAVEMLHTYSLIHDDLPCMDNDVLRRGKPTNHIVYGECIAVLAGDALQAAAFEVLLGAQLPAERVVAAASVLADAAGEMGICGGQLLDMKGEQRLLNLEEVTRVHNMKTAAMIVAAAKMGVISAGGTKEQIAASEEYARALGIAFQVRDDMLDAISTTEELGKTVGSDKACGKSTFVSLFGLDACEKIVLDATEKAKRALVGKFENVDFLCWLADTLAERKH